MKQQKRRNFIFASLALSGSLCISAFAGEIVLRLLGYHGAPESVISMLYRVDDPILDWRRVPNSEMKEGRVSYRFNNSGFRDANHTLVKEPGMKRIVVLGDSVTEGYGVEWKSLFSSIIQSRLGQKFEVILIAAPGLNTPQEVHLFEQEGLRYKPDLVIVNFVLNDCDFYSNLEGGQRYEAEKGAKIGLVNLPISPRLKGILKSSAFIYFLKGRIENLKGRILGGDNTDYFKKIWSRDENRWKVTSGLNKLTVLQKENQFDVLVIIWPLITEYRDYGFVSVHEWVRRQAEERKFATIDLLPNFSRIGYRELQLTSEDNVHPNAVGHSIAAASFLDWHRSRERVSFPRMRMGNRMRAAERGGRGTRGVGEARVEN